MMGRHPGRRDVGGEGVVGRTRGRGSDGRRRVDEGDEPAHLLESIRLHEDVVLGEQQCRDLGEFADRRTVCVRDDRAQLVEGVVQVVHASPLPRVDAQSSPPLVLRLPGPRRSSPVVVAQSLQVRLRRAATAVVLAATRRAPWVGIATGGRVLRAASLAVVGGRIGGCNVPAHAQSERRRRLGHGAGEVDGQTTQVQRRHRRHLRQVGWSVSATGVQDGVHAGERLHCTADDKYRNETTQLTIPR